MHDWNEAQRIRDEVLAAIKKRETGIHLRELARALILPERKIDRALQVLRRSRQITYHPRRGWQEFRPLVITREMLA